MNLIRVIEVYDTISADNVSTIPLTITSYEILELLSDLVLNADDCPEEIYDPYILSEFQTRKLLDYASQIDVEVDPAKFIYELNCYESKAK